MIVTVTFGIDSENYVIMRQVPDHKSGAVCAELRAAWPEATVLAVREPE